MVGGWIVMVVIVVTGDLRSDVLDLVVHFGESLGDFFVLLGGSD